MKSENAFRTISEVAGALDVPQHVLRFWETRFSQVRPTKRGGGRRYYRPEDVALLKGIRTLLYGDGFTIKGVQKILRERGVQHVVAAYREGTSGALASVDQATTEHLQTTAGTALASNGGVPSLPLAEMSTSDSPGRLMPGMRENIQSTLNELGSLKTILDLARG